MADYDSSLPARTESPGDIDIFVSDSTTPAQKLKVNADGSIDTNVVIPSGSKVEITDGTDDLEVNADGSINVVATATDLDIRDLAFATDSVDVSGSSVTATATDLDIRDLVFATDKVDVSGSAVTVSATDLDIRDISAAQDNIAISDGADTLGVNADGSINSVVTATDLDIRDLDAATDSVQSNLFDEAGVAFSLTNPLPVTTVSDQSGTEVVDYQTTASVIKDASTNHDYVVSGGVSFLGEEAWVSGSGKLKLELLVNGSTVFVGFNSTANPNIRIPLEKIVKADAAQTIRFTITNRDNQPQDVYSTLLGLEV